MKTAHAQKDVYVGKWQDKGVVTTARAEARQAAPLPRPLGALSVNTPAVRSQNGHPTREKLRHTTLHLRPLVRRMLEQKAAEAGASISAIGDQALYEWALSTIERQHATTLKVELKHIIREELAAFGHRIVFFLMRIAFAAEQASILITKVLKVLLQMRGKYDEKTYYATVDESAKLAKRNILRNTPQFKSLLAEWEAAYPDGRYDKRKEEAN